MPKSKPKQVQFYVEGMHCPSCELLMQQEFKSLPGVVNVSADAPSKTVILSYQGPKPTTQDLNHKIKPFNYEAFTNPQAKASAPAKQAIEWIVAIAIAVAVALSFFLFERWLNANMPSSEGSLIVRNFIWGLIASVSTCAALVGGIILAQAKAWQRQKFFPYLSFNLSRLVSFVVLGGLLGLLGDALSPSIETNALIVIIAAIIMLVLGLQMLNLAPVLNKLRLQLPSFLTKDTVSKQDQRNWLMPAVLGAVTFFIPCSFTLGAQLQALSEGSALKGSLIMGAFALGTLPVLLFISFTSHSLSLRANTQGLFLKVAGLLVIAFALYTLNNQLNVLGYPSLSDLTL